MPYITIFKLIIPSVERKSFKFVYLGSQNLDLIILRRM